MILALALCLSLPFAGAAQEAGSSPSASALPVSPPTDLAFTQTPLGRFETIAVGSFPIAFFYFGIGFDLGSYFSHGFDPLYAPWPFKSDRAPAPSDSDKQVRILGAALISLGLASLDALLRPGADKRRRVAHGTEAFPQPPPQTGEGLSLPGPSSPPGGGPEDGATAEPPQAGTGAQLDSKPFGE